MSAAKAEIQVGGHAIGVSNSDRVMFPASGVTKGEVVDYYHRVANWMVPHLRGRPVSMQRVRENIDTQVFYQKDMPSHFPDWIHRVTVPKVGGTVTHVVCDDAATLVYIANQGCITPHVWLSKVDNLDKPDRLIIDLDPGSGGVADARFAAHLARELLAEVKLVPYLMATGSRGYHLVVPLKVRDSFDEVRETCFGLADALARRAPDRLTTEFHKVERAGRLFLDCNRNAWAQTAVPAYSVRPREGAPVAMPISWDELDTAEPDGWNVRNIWERLSASWTDPWAGFAKSAKTLDAARKWLAEA
jgi:bifunctional non-homologous end joining protein LigD